MIDTAYVSWGALQFNVLYEYLDNDEGEIWVEAQEIYLQNPVNNGVNMLPYLSDQVVEGLEQQIVFIHGSTD
mgnify:FL=1|tara:strand:- start:1098 stop:1313 length:216 start_codon:yes stop_codon:yes gene_type:complete